MKRLLCGLGLLLAVAAGVRADEIRLKDGSKIIGVIVDFENDSFKVQTAYGFAMVRKDSIAQIIPSEQHSGGEAPKPASPTASTTSAKPATARVTPTAPALAPTALPMPAPNPRPAPPAPMAAATPAPAPAAAPAAAPTPVV